MEEALRLASVTGTEIEVTRTIDDFLAAHPCEMTVERIGVTPSSDKERFSFRCEIFEIATGPRHTVRVGIIVEYHMGIGHALKPKRRGGHDYLPSDIRKGSDGFWYVYQGEWQKVVIWPTPELRDVIDCLRVDASCIDDGQTFIEFAREFGYESLDQYEEARKAYDGCHEALARLRRLFGRTATEELLYQVEGL
jgi:hypothetical protein